MGQKILVFSGIGRAMTKNIVEDLEIWRNFWNNFHVNSIS